MEKKGRVFLAAALGLVILWEFGPLNAGLASQTTTGQSAEAISLAERQFAEAVTLLKQENFSEAIAAYEKVIQLMPESPIAQDARYWIGQTYFRMGKYDEALAVFKKLLKDYPKSPIIPVTQLMLTRVEQEKEAQKMSVHKTAAADQTVIVDPNTGVEFKRTHALTGRSDVIYNSNAALLSPNGKFLLDGTTVIPLDGTAPFSLEEENGLRGNWSPDGKMVAYYAEKAIWIVPVSPESGRPAGPAKKLLDGKYEYQHPVSWSPDSKKIAFPRMDQTTEGDIWVLSIEDGHLTRLTDDPGFEADACWSPDGKTLAYTTRGIDGVEIRLVPAAGGESRKIIGIVYGRVRSWSPDGTWIAYDDRQDLHLYRVADSRTFAVNIPDDDVGHLFSWSKDGKKMFLFRSSYEWRTTLRIASTSGGPSFHLARKFELWPYRQFWTAANDKIVTQRAGDSWFVIIPLSGGEPIPLELNVPSKEKVDLLSLSPDRKYLLFSVELKNGGENLCTVPVSLEQAKATGSPIVVFENWERRKVSGAQSAWSPDGKRIALIHRGDIWVTSSKEERPVQITKTPAREGNLFWSQKGDEIAFNSVTNPDDRRLMVVSASGGEPTALISRFETWRWSPDGKALTVISDNVVSNIPLEGGKANQILDLSGRGFTGRYWELTWLPDGKHFAFIGEQEKGKGYSSQIYLASAETGEIIELAADDKVFKDGFYLSPDGKWISYYTDEFIKTRPASTIWEVNVEDLVKEKR